MKPNEFSQLKVLPEIEFSRSNLLREERHPNSVTAPPINRGSMAPRPWRGFWNSIGTALLVSSALAARPGRPAAGRFPAWHFSRGSVQRPSGASRSSHWRC